MHYDTMETKSMQLLSDTARARLRELEARAALVRWQAAAGIAGGAFVAKCAEALQSGINQQLARDNQSPRRNEV